MFKFFNFYNCFPVVPVTHTIHRLMPYIVPVGGNDVIACGTQGGRSTLSQYNLQTGVETGRMPLDRKPDGMAAIVLNGRQCVALAYT